MSVSKKIVVIGAGSFGTCLSVVLAQNGHEVHVWGRDQEKIDTITATKENSRYLPGIALPDSIQWSADRSCAEDKDIALIAVPSRYFRSTLESFKPHLKPDCIIVSVVKGLDPNTGHRMTQVAEEILDRGPVAALSGPSHAEEVAQGIPGAVTVGCKDKNIAETLQHTFNNQTFRVYRSSDVVGVEIGGVMKNVVAIAAGVSDGIGFGDNTKAALITRGLSEIRRLGVAFGADPETFTGLSGLGDLIVTCASRHSRNRGVGERLGKGETIQQILDSMEQVAEGYWTAETARRIAHEKGIDAPITEEVYQVLYEGKDPARAVSDLLSRDPKPE